MKRIEAILKNYENKTNSSIYCCVYKNYMNKYCGHNCYSCHRKVIDFLDKACKEEIATHELTRFENNLVKFLFDNGYPIVARTNGKIEARNAYDSFELDESLFDFLNEGESVYLFELLYRNGDK